MAVFSRLSLSCAGTGRKKVSYVGTCCEWIIPIEKFQMTSSYLHVQPSDQNGRKKRPLWTNQHCELFAYLLRIHPLGINYNLFVLWKHLIATALHASEKKLKFRLYETTG